MNVIAVLLLVWLRLTSSFGDVVEDFAGDDAQERPTDPPTSAVEEAFPADLGVPGTDGEIEHRFLSRTPLPTCGMVQVTDAALQGPGVAYDWRCLAAARADGAESLVVLTATAGDPVYTYYRLNPHGPMEIFIDRRADPDADTGWLYRQCEPAPDLRDRPCAD